MEFAGFQELRLFRGDPYGRVFHALLQDGDLIGISAAAKGGLPAFPDALGVFDGAGMLQHATRSRTVGEELGSVFLAGDGHADGVLGHGDGAVAYQAIKAKTGDVQHIGGAKIRYITLHGGCIIGTSRVLVVQLTSPVSIHGHAVWHQRIEGNDLAFSVADHLGIGIPPEKKMCHEGFPKHKGTHFRIRLVVEQMVQRMVEGFFFPTVLLVTVQVKRQTCHRLG